MEKMLKVRIGDLHKVRIQCRNCKTEIVFDLIQNRSFPSKCLVCDDTIPKYVESFIDKLKLTQKNVNEQKTPIFFELD